MPDDRLTTLEAYSAGRLPAGQAMARLGLETRYDLLVAVCGAGLKPPRPPDDEVRAQVEAALPLLRAALREER